MLKNYTVSRYLTRSFIVLLLILPKFGFFTWTSVNLSNTLLYINPIFGLQALLTSPAFLTVSFLSIVAILTLIYILLGRIFCGWICPFGFFLELLHKARSKLFVNIVKTDNNTQTIYEFKYYFLMVLLVVTLITRVSILEVFSPLTMFKRIILFGFTMEIIFIFAVVAYDISSKNNGGWCFSLCPWGAFYSLLAKRRILSINVKSESCIKCLKCTSVCKGGEYILRPHIISEGERKVLSDCINCGDCIDNCPQNALKFDFNKSNLINKKTSSEKLTKEGY
ncbi:4Fe-4S binding protein [Natranaerofaba carboxydovora]|uniref:4Fe-4S binding protein n=1 Tax=Natranaerofaba carboxydovora TaxID=2742683 RepID=UPI001F1408EE|nr:4Fe-4S binding protein [Natranaerofaba carboxydovora]UMZ73773.1 Putative electron transport protein YccM [Natranaerofaba carboxydovora]